MTVKEAMTYLSEKGYRCSAGTVRALAKRGRLRYYRPGVGSQGRMEFTQGNLDAFLRKAELGGDDAPKAVAERAPRQKVAVARAAPDNWRADYEKAKEA